MGNENQSMAMLNSYGQSPYTIHRGLYSPSNLSIKQLEVHNTLQAQLDTEMKANGFGWRESQDKPKID